MTIDPRPNEVDPAIPFDQDHHHATYDPEAAYLFWRQLVQADRGLGEFRSHFVGKATPVHFFWGAMDLACTRFSGREAPATVNHQRPADCEQLRSGNPPPRKNAYWWKA